MCGHSAALQQCSSKSAVHWAALQAAVHLPRHHYNQRNPAALLTLRSSVSTLYVSRRSRNRTASTSRSRTALPIASSFCRSAAGGQGRRQGQGHCETGGGQHGVHRGGRAFPPSQQLGPTVY